MLTARVARPPRRARRACLAAAVALVQHHAAAQQPVGAGGDLDHLVQTATGGGFWGAALVARDGEVLLAKGYGAADYRDQPNGANTRFEIASLAKQFTAAGLLRLEMQGRLSLDDVLPTFFDNVPDDKRAITVRQLLTHTAGVSPYIGLPYASTASRDEFVAYVMRQPLAAPPGETFAYANAGYALAAAVIEAASGDSFETFMHAEVFAPAGLASTGFIGEPIGAPALDAARLGAEAATAADWRWGWGYRGMGGVVTTAEDLHRWHVALQGDAVLDESARDRLHDAEQAGYACGWIIGATHRGTLRASHAGAVQGFACTMVRFPDDDAVIILLSNGRTDLDAVQRALAEALFPRPSVSLAIERARLPLDAHAAFRMDRRGAPWTARAGAERIDLSFAPADGAAPVVTVGLPLAEAARVRDALRAEVAERAGRAAPDGPSEIGVYLAPYAAHEQPRVALDDVEVIVMPQYVGVDERAERRVDRRITLVLRDAARGAWPVITKLADQAAIDLADALDAALGEP